MITSIMNTIIVFLYKTIILFPPPFVKYFLMYIRGNLDFLCNKGGSLNNAIRNPDFTVPPVTVPWVTVSPPVPSPRYRSNDTNVTE
jgi:hypothetical protein